MPTSTFFMGLPNPSVGADNNTWGGNINTCINGFDALAVAAVPPTFTGAASLGVFNGTGLIEADATTGSFVLTLPSATLAANKGRRYSIIKVDSTGNTVTISGAQNISGQASVILSTQWSTLNITSDGSQWINTDFEAVIATPISVSNGGTGATSLTLNGLLYGNGTSPVQVTAVGATGTVLTGTGVAPAFSATPTVTSITTTGGTSTIAGVLSVTGTSSFTTANPTFFSSTGSGAVVLATSPTLVTPVLGAATATSLSVAIAAVVIGSKITTYNSQVTAGNGVATIVAATSQKSETAADANVLTHTPVASAGSYKVRFVMSVSAATAATLGWTATWKDSNGVAQTPTNLALFQSGVAAPALTFTPTAGQNFYAEAQIDIDNSATNIVVQLTFTGTSFTAKVSATIERIV